MKKFIILTELIYNGTKYQEGSCVVLVYNIDRVDSCPRPNGEQGCSTTGSRIHIKDANGHAIMLVKESPEEIYAMLEGIAK